MVCHQCLCTAHHTPRHGAVKHRLAALTRPLLSWQEPKRSPQRKLRRHQHCSRLTPRTRGSPSRVQGEHRSPKALAKDNQKDQIHNKIKANGSGRRSNEKADPTPATFEAQAGGKYPLQAAKKAPCPIPRYSKESSPSYRRTKGTRQMLYGAASSATQSTTPTTARPVVTADSKGAKQTEKATKMQSQRNPKPKPPQRKEILQTPNPWEHRPSSKRTCMQLL